MAPWLRLLSRRLLLSLIALGVSLAGPSHEALCHRHVESCCTVEHDQGEPEATAYAAHGEHECPLCFLTPDAPAAVQPEIPDAVWAGRTGDLRPRDIGAWSRRGTWRVRGPPQVIGHLSPFSPEA
jgi:hypothetical protein